MRARQLRTVWGTFLVAKRYGGGNGVRGFDFVSHDRGHALASVLHLKALTQEEVPGGVCRFGLAVKR